MAGSMTLAALQPSPWLFGLMKLASLMHTAALRSSLLRNLLFFNSLFVHPLKRKTFIAVSSLLGCWNPAQSRMIWTRGRSGACQMLVALGLISVLSIAHGAPVFAAEASTSAPTVQTDETSNSRSDGEPRSKGPRNPYDMKALRQFDAGSHSADQPG